MPRSTVITRSARTISASATATTPGGRLDRVEIQPGRELAERALGELAAQRDLAAQRLAVPQVAEERDRRR